MPPSVQSTPRKAPGLRARISPFVSGFAAFFLVGVLVVMSVGVVTIYSNSMTELQNTNPDPHDGLVFRTGQLMNETVALQQALFTATNEAAAAQDPAAPVSERLRSEIALRAEIVLGRLDILSLERTVTVLSAADGYAEAQAALDRVAGRIDVDLIQKPILTKADIQDFQPVLDQFITQANWFWHISVKLYHDQKLDDQAATRGNLQRIVFAWTILVLAGVGLASMAAYFLVQYRRQNALLEQRVDDRTRDLRQNNLELLYREARLEQAARAAHIGYWISRPDGRIVETSGLFREIYGLQPEADLSDWSRLGIHIHPEDRDRLTACIATARETGRDYDIQYRIIDAAGGVRHIAEKVVAVQNEEGAFQGFSGTSQDITQEKDAQYKLMDALRSEAAANRSKSEFLANMSHELRTPLNAIIGFAETMKLGLFGSIENQRYTRYVEDIHSSANHLLALIGDILDISRIEVGKFDLQEEPVDLRALIQDALRLVRQSATERGVDLINGSATTALSARGDARKLKQVLLNILSNAIKFTERGGSVEIETQTGPTGLKISVRDTGVGIPAAQQERVFEPFHQVGSVLTRKDQGAGIGLALSRRLAELHDGGLTLESKEGVGTTVTLTLPRSRLIDTEKTADGDAGDGGDNNGQVAA
ncbi:MAG: ATP-binding protein [Alphaproteobacteria bacterium]|nr:ATP-binding protein [Alphaproteobacteria bacterium]